jgi:hypothetical protein
LQRRWLALFRAVAARDASGMATIAEELLATQRELSNEAREYLVLASMTGAVAGGQGARAVTLWSAQKADLRDAANAPVFRLLRCHAERETCVAAWRPYAER